MVKVATLSALVVAAGLTFTTDQAVAGIEVPPVGTTLVYKCSGPWKTGATYKIAWIKDGIVRVDSLGGSRTGWREQHVFTFGLTLFKETQYQGSTHNTGNYTQSFDIDNLEDLAKLEPGATFSGDVTERDSEGKWTWGYTIKVGQPEILAHPARGRIEVIPVVEKRLSYDGTYSSVNTTSYEREGGLRVRWHYKDVDGEEICDLVKME